MTKIKILFGCEDNIREMIFPINILIEDALLQYLKTTNSRLDLSTGNIWFLYNGRILNDIKILKKTLIDLDIESGHIIKVIKRDDFTQAGEERVSIRFRYFDFPNKIISFPSSTLIKDALIEYLKETNSIIDISPEKKMFTFNAKILNTEKYLNKTLRNLKITNNSKIEVRNIMEIPGGFY